MRIDQKNEESLLSNGSWKHGYLQAPNIVEQMNVSYSQDTVTPLTHTVWIGDFPCIAKHDVPCPVCFERHALMSWNNCKFGPCSKCQETGWVTIKFPKPLRWLSTFAEHRVRANSVKMKLLPDEPWQLFWSSVIIALVYLSVSYLLYLPFGS